MAESTVDLFKFVTVRATQTAAAEDLHVIRDPRLGVSAPAGQQPDMATDGHNYEASPAASLIYQLVLELHSGATSPPDVIEVNRLVADRIVVEAVARLSPTGTGIEHVDALAPVMNQIGPDTTHADLEEAVLAHWPLGSTPDWRSYVNAAPDGTGPSLARDQGDIFDLLYLGLVAKRRLAVSLEPLIRGLRVLHLLRLLESRDAARPFARNEFAPLLAANPAVHRLITGLLAYYRPFNPIKPVGIGDLLVVKQLLCHYEPGEIAHIENLLDGESKLRRIRRINQTEDLVSLVQDRSEVEERELSTSQRFELKSETESTIQSDLAAEVSGQISGRYGAVEYSANAGVSYSTSSSDSRRGANNFAKDVVDRSLSRIQTNVREERTTTRLTRVDELDRHELTNATGGNLAGIYRWVDKVYKAQVYNYGKRLMFEFVIPEPAAFVLSVFEHERQQTARPDIPQPPVRPNLDVASISPATVSTYGAIYNLSGLDPEPPSSKSLPAAVGRSGLTGANSFETQFQIPDGYAAVSATISGDWDGESKTEHGIRVSVGGQTSRRSDAGVIHMGYDSDTLTFNPPLVGNVAAVVFTYRVKAFGLSIALQLARTEERYRAWQISVYEAIMDAYTTAEREYRQAMDAYEAELAGFRVSQGVTIQGRNPRVNQELIRTELRKSCLSMIALQFDSDKSDDVVFDAMQSRQETLPVEAIVTTATETVTTTTPEPGTTITVTTTATREDVAVVDTPVTVPAINVPEAVSDGQVVQFLEQAFEWQQVNYLFYPYFWGRMPRKWYESQTYYDEVDPLLAKFLQAGAARVLVAVRPGFEGAVQHYLYTREPWNGGPVPDIDDPLYLAVHAELRDQQDDLNNAEPYGDPWTVVVPTPLLWLQPDASLPTFDCGSADDTDDGERDKDKDKEKEKEKEKDPEKEPDDKDPDDKDPDDKDQDQGQGQGKDDKGPGDKGPGDKGPGQDGNDPGDKDKADGGGRGRGGDDPGPGGSPTRKPPAKM